ncbi:MAG: acyl carrier protein [Candidatus Riflebacteria bacterium]|nr:acyl carrier protein [Candidatus Riflebacteria bacterium]
MDKNEIFEKIKEALQESLGTPSEKITLKARIIDDLGCDSLDLLDILFSIEEKFGLKIKRGQVEAMAREGLGEGEFEQNGLITEKGAERLKQIMPEVDHSQITPGMGVYRIPYLFTVETFCRLVEKKLSENTASNK